MPSISSINVYQLYTIVYSIHHGTLELDDSADHNNMEMMGLANKMKIYAHDDSKMIME